jgi:hypothetical protein
MKNLILSFFVLLAMLAGTSCKKDKPLQSEHLTLEQKILGQWTWKSTEHFHIPAAQNDYTTNYPASDYWEFKADNKLTAFTSNQSFPTNWHKVDDNSFYIDGLGSNNPYKIITATANQLVIQLQVMDNSIPYITRETFTKPFILP